MWTLLRADVTQLGNLLRPGEGRRTLGLALVGYFCFGLGGLAIGGRLLASDQMLTAVREAPEIVAPLLFVILLLLPAILGAAAILPESRGLLFGPQAELLLLAPVSHSAILRRTLVRVAFTAVPIQWTLALPILIGITESTPMGRGVIPAYLLLSLATGLLGCVVVLLGQVLLRRYCGGPRLKLLVNLAGVVITLVLMVAVGAGFIAGREEQEALAATLQSASDLPLLVRLPGTALAACAGLVPFQAEHVLLVLIPALVYPALRGAAFLYAGALEAGQALRSRGPRREGSVRRWPSRALPSLVWKDLLVTLHERANIAAYALLGVTALLFATQGLSSPGPFMSEKAPALYAQLPPLCNGWVIFLMLVTSLQGLGYLQNEPRDLELFALAPVRRRHVLTAKMMNMAPPLIWSGLAYVGGALFVRGVEPSVALSLAAFMIPPSAAMILAVFAIATLPTLQVGALATKSTAQVSGMLVVAAVPAVLGILLLMAANEARSDLSRHFLGGPTPGFDPLRHTWTRLVALWIVGGGLAGAGLALANRNYRRLLGPRD